MSTVSVSVNDLDQALQQCIKLAHGLPDTAWQYQSHRELSPIGWHIGHMVFVEYYWVYEQLLNSPVSEAQKNFYFPWLSPKPDRGKQLPDRDSHLAQLLQMHQQTLDALDNAGPGMQLMKDDYLLLFLIQHHKQHRETLHHVIMQHALNSYKESYSPETCITPCKAKHPDIVFEDGITLLGHGGGAIAYDNELPAHEHVLDNFAISRNPVSSAEYLGFIEDGGYRQQHNWSPDGWRWRTDNNITGPTHWRQHDNGRWYQVTGEGYKDLKASEPIYMLSHHEADAFANWAGFRLPTEWEWEHSHLQLAWGSCWEWCSNTFYPYPGFRAFPYDGYSTPWFDNRHYTLRGASHVTSRWIKRPSFRNFYTADTRHIFSGLRLAA